MWRDMCSRSRPISKTSPGFEERGGRPRSSRKSLLILKAERPSCSPTNETSELVRDFFVLVRLRVRLALSAPGGDEHARFDFYFDAGVGSGGNSAPRARSRCSVANSPSCDSCDSASDGVGDLG